MTISGDTRQHHRLRSGHARATALAVVSVLLLSSPLAPRAHAGLSDDLESVCGTVKSSATVSAEAAASANEQRKPYCDAAREAKKAASSNGLLWKVWAGVAGVCTTACVMSFMGPGLNPMICTGTNLAASVTDAVVTKQFASSLISIGTSASQLFINKGAKAAAAPASGAPGAAQGAAAKAPPRKDYAACMSAAMAGVQVFTKKKAADDASKTAKENLASAKKILSTSDVVTVAATGGSNAALPTLNPAGGSGGDTGAGSTDSQGTGSSSSSGLAAVGTTDACSGSLDSAAGYQGAMDCAVASDKALPSFVRSPAFPSEFAANTGQSLPSFMNKSSSPSGALKEAMGSGLSADGTRTLAAAVQAAEENLVAPSDSAYAGGGAGGAPSGGGHADAAPDPQAMLAAVMGQFGQKGESKASGGVDTMAFGELARRNPASIPQDRAISLFERISFRYARVFPRLNDIP